ncbi:hypothetical protein [Vibrio vulnificus]|uniref:Inner membrane protein yeeR n=1 Tax=Vibrio vulnificus TaxID=672 RepID=A0AAW4HJF5_VIBVL|nr:hypothetical protein [Vibrio vulnificus]EGQ9994043.1 hypothetical protein [Vibrio vulnificus]EJV2652487.1 hypothetical protein [Vibrio vulnificus]ELA3118078.1 hypothetical protein [Vibrio vulnificus]ELF6474228.1 hypothetical protein [Vibrio vulnificus]ELV8768450.1 hypothetical protein [Vibrio vulnificus]
MSKKIKSSDLNDSSKLEKEGVFAGIANNAQEYTRKVKYHGERGHGFAAEDANHLDDIFSGKNAQIVGDDNAKNGADRLVNGQEIQTKYCKTGSKCISECFKQGEFRYYDRNGEPMQIEVPSDLHSDAVRAMRDRIEKGQVDGVNDPEMAEKIVKKGSYTYEQAKNIAKAGNVDSLVYDAKNGVIHATSAMGISAAITFAISIWNGDKWEVAVKNAAYSGMQTFGVTWVSSLITAQLSRTGIEQSLRSSTDWVVRQLGKDVTAWLANGMRSGANIYGAAAANHLSKLLRGNVVTGVVTTVVLSSVDAYRFFKDEVSGAQLFKNVAVTATSVAGGTAGWMGGAAAGAAIGSAVPVIGTTAGGIIGGLLGAFGGGTAAQKGAKAVLDEFIREDAEEMLDIVNDIFAEMASEYLLNKSEAEEVISQIKNLDMAKKMREMYASGNRKAFARKMLTPMMDTVAESRTKITIPEMEQLMSATKEIVTELAAA